MNKHLTFQEQFSDIAKITQLLAVREEPCISVLVNLFTNGNMLPQNIHNITRFVDRAVSSVDLWHCSEVLKKRLKVELQSQAASFDNTGAYMAIGIFVSDSVSMRVEFPFSVIECSIVGRSFEVRDLLYFEQYLEPYYVLALKKDRQRLFKGRWNTLVKINDHDGKSVLHDTHELVALTGTHSLMNDFKASYPHPDNVICVDGLSADKSPLKLGDKIWPAIHALRSVRITEMIAKVADLPLRYRAEGLRDTWEAAIGGRGLLLLVERDFQRIAYRLSGSDFIRLHPPKEKYETIADAVDDVIEMVRAKHGRVVFTEPGQLSKYGNIVLTLRY